MRTRSFLISLCMIAAAIALPACSDEEFSVSDDQEILFEVNYVNYAWGFQNNGFLIDKTGRVRTYDKPKDWKFASEGPFTVAEMDERVSKTTIANYTVPANELSQYVSKMRRVSDKDFTTPASVGADMGASAFYIYRYDTGSKTYNAILLQSVGDDNVYNKDSDAKEIADWLVKVRQALL
ncbi:hypothetical protein [Dyadobacter jiangsuensis]|uniref:Uncharacterized protein n=1 Tax=Dyadobacter jiangsuensis TaxID=1591085 RepID=A0A2P8FPF3_9BACT|nr:hypothetical protein [Dyadobacter jiangsuensis]PSL23611.1 hypothetical protein CLV60_116167 [Dyadobacter jiangsuensis]